MVEFYLLTFPRLPLRKKEHKSYFGKNRTQDFRTSRCAAYLLDHSGDERLHRTKDMKIRERPTECIPIYSPVDPGSDEGGLVSVRNSTFLGNV
ncbi:unnamed protein product, partial [Ascophyllum nodosum]